MRSSADASYRNDVRGAMPFLPAGKLPADMLQAVLAANVIHDPRVVIGARLGEDAVIDTIRTSITMQPE